MAQSLGRCISVLPCVVEYPYRNTTPPTGLPKEAAHCGSKPWPLHICATLAVHASCMLYMCACALHASILALLLSGRTDRCFLSLHPMCACVLHSICVHAFCMLYMYMLYVCMLYVCMHPACFYSPFMSGRTHRYVLSLRCACALHASTLLCMRPACFYSPFMSGRTQ